MREINCYIPIKVRIVGELSEAHIEQLGQTLTRTLAARLEQARRTLAEHGYASAQATIVTWPGERVDEARLYHGGYSLPSYDNGGKTVSVPVVSGIPSSGKQSDPLEEDWQNELDEAARLANEGASPSEKAFGKRLWLLLIELRPVVFTDEDQLIKLFERSHQTAPSESETLKLAAGRLTIEQLLDIDGDAFPNTWADKVYQDFHSDVDLDALEKTYQLRKKGALSTGIAAELWARGLPLSLHQARNLKVDDVVQLVLGYDRLKQSSSEITNAYAQAMFRWLQAGSYYGFAKDYEMGIRSYRAQLRRGELVGNQALYRVVTKSSEAFRRRLQDYERGDAIPTLREATFEMSIASSGNFGGVHYYTWPTDGLEAFWKQVQTVDHQIAGAGFNDCLTRAFIWAFERAFFEVAGLKVWENIKENGWKMLAEAVSLILVGVGAQLVPGLNVALDIVLLIEFGFSALSALADLIGALKDAGSAKSVLDMERASARLAQTLVGTAADILMWAIAWTGGKLVNRVMKYRQGQKFIDKHDNTLDARKALADARGDVAKAERNLVAQRERLAAEQRRKAAEVKHTGKLEEEAATKTKREQESEAAAKEKKEQLKPWEKEEAEAKQTVAAKRKQKKGAAKEEKPLEEGKRQPRQGMKPGEKRDFVAAYNNALEDLRTTHNEIQSLEQQLNNLRQRKEPFAGKRELQEDLSERLEGAKQSLGNLETAAKRAEQALRESTLPLHEKLGAAARNTKEFRDVVRLANGEDKVGGFKVDLKKDHIAPDHIVAIRRITTDPKFQGFEELSWEVQLEIVNLPDNLVAMKGSFNSSKGARPWREWNQARQYYDSKIVDGMIVREARVEQLIVDKIAEKLKAAPRKGL